MKNQNTPQPTSTRNLTSSNQSLQVVHGTSSMHVPSILLQGGSPGEETTLPDQGRVVFCFPDSPQNREKAASFAYAACRSTRTGEGGSPILVFANIPTSAVLPKDYLGLMTENEEIILSSIRPEWITEICRVSGICEECQNLNWFACVGDKLELVPIYQNQKEENHDNKKKTDPAMARARIHSQRGRDSSKNLL